MHGKYREKKNCVADSDAASSEKLPFERTRIFNRVKWFDSIWYEDITGIVCEINVVDSQGEFKIW